LEIETQYSFAIIGITMKLLGTVTEKDFGRTEQPEKRSTYRVRKAARAILVNVNNEIALMHVANHNYYKLPGGGVDDGEEIHDALLRELQEEVGASEFDVLCEIGEVDEYRDEWEVKAEHYGFVAKLTGPLHTPQRTQKELDHGYTTVWAQNIDDAIDLVESGTPTEYGQGFERKRELIFLRQAKAAKLI